MDGRFPPAIPYIFPATHCQITDPGNYRKQYLVNKQVKRTVSILVGIAVLFYLAFIYMAVTGNVVL